MSSAVELFEAVNRGDVETVRTMLVANRDLINERDESGATLLHHAAFNGNRQIVQFLIQRGAAINSIDSRFGATPTGWAIEYLRELGGYLATDLDDLAFAIRQGDIPWVKRFVQRFPSIRRTNDAQGRPFRQLALESGNREIVELFEIPSPR
jgi:ankyrin repeat protein